MTHIQKRSPRKKTDGSRAHMPISLSPLSVICVNNACMPKRTADTPTPASTRPRRLHIDAHPEKKSDSSAQRSRWCYSFISAHMPNLLSELAKYSTCVNRMHACQEPPMSTRYNLRSSTPSLAQFTYVCAHRCSTRAILSTAKWGLECNDYSLFSTNHKGINEIP